MNRPPSPFVSVPHSFLADFVSRSFIAVGLTGESARFLADCLVINDLRGVFSHGTRLAIYYVRQFKRGDLNPRPSVRVLTETKATIRLDGDGGLGYFPANQAAEWISSRAKEEGVAAAVTSHHGHIGAAGLYARIAVQRHLISFVTSGHQLSLEPAMPLLSDAGGSPICFAIPARNKPPIVLDFAATGEVIEQVFHFAPGLFFRALGLGAVCQTVGGFLSGLPARPRPPSSPFKGASQGAFLLAVDPARFLALDEFLNQVDDYIAQVERLQPAPGYEKSHLPGGIEWDREHLWRHEGVPVGPNHLASLQALSIKTGVALPF